MTMSCYLFFIITLSAQLVLILSAANVRKVVSKPSTKNKQALKQYGSINLPKTHYYNLNITSNKMYFNNAHKYTILINEKVIGKIQFRFLKFYNFNKLMSCQGLIFIYQWEISWKLPLITI